MLFFTHTISSSSPRAKACLLSRVQAQPLPFISVGLSYCSIDTSIPGPRCITYTALHRQHLPVSTYRTVIVEAACLPGDKQCTDGRCSQEGVCLSDVTVEELEDLCSSSSSGRSMILLAGRGEWWGQQPRAQLLLVTTATLGEVVYVPLVS